MGRNNNHTSRQKIHVLEILSNAIAGGMENHVLNLLGALSPHVYQVTCLCPYESAITAEMRRMGYNVLITPIGEDTPWRSVHNTVGLVRSLGIHLLHAHLPWAHQLAGVVGALTQRPVVATMHGMYALDSVAIRQVTDSWLIAVCQAAYLEALACGVPRSRITLIHNGVDLNRYTIREDDGRLRQAIGVPADVPLIGYVGRLSWEKGPDHFIRAAGVVHEQRPDVHFVLVGEGPMAGELKMLINELALESCVHLAGLWPDTATVYPALDILGHTSRAEGTPLALLEGMACGRPFAGMGIGGVLELVQIGVTGLLSAPGDWRGVAHDLLNLLARPEVAQQMGQAARQRAVETFSLQEMVTQTEALFCRLVRAHSRSREEQPATAQSLLAKN